MNMSLGMGMHLDQSHAQRMELGMNVTQALKMLQTFRDPASLTATRGIEGILISDEILKQDSVTDEERQKLGAWLAAQ